MDPDLIGVQTREILEKTLDFARYFGLDRDFLARMQTFSAELARWGAVVNLTASPTAPEETAFHIIDSLAPLDSLVPLDDREIAPDLAGKFHSARQIVDIGSGAGYPGLILAAALAATSSPRVILTESRRRRASFLTAAVSRMNLASVTVSNVRVAADWPADSDIVVSRAVRLDTPLLDAAAAALEPGGIAVFYTNPAPVPDSKRPRNARMIGPLLYPYEVRCRGLAVSRILSIWQKR